MSTLSGSSPISTGLYAYSQQQQVTDNSAASTNGNAAASVVSSAEQNATGQIQGAHHGHHHHGGGANGLQSQIQQAVTSALSDADGDSDPNQTIQSAIEQVLQNPASATSDPTTAALAQPTTAQTTGAPGQPGSATFEQYLQSQGVDTDQFKSDLAAAFQQVQGTGQQADLSTAFSSLPPGSVVDASA
jgi:hypothetical protein